METRALYNSLRASWQLDPTLPVKLWQVADYRSYSLEQLFAGLAQLDINLTRSLFSQLAEESESPEDLSETLLPDEIDSSEEADKIYLLVFELWRRLLPAKQSISLFCDELDYQIELFDTGKVTSAEGIEDCIANLQSLLNENADDGTEPHILFQSIVQGCAHDLEGFLYDFISSQIDNQNFLYAIEMIEGLKPYVIDSKWFNFLHAKALAHSDVEEFRKRMHQLIKSGQKKPDLEFSLEMLSYVAKKGEDRLFLTLVQETIQLLEIEEDFWDLLASCEEFFHFEDNEKKEHQVAEILERRLKNSSEQVINKNDSDLITLKQLLGIKI